MHSAQLIVIGDSNCGKTALITAFLKRQYFDAYIPTVFENYETAIDLQGKHVHLAIWDTSGNMRKDEKEQLVPLSFEEVDVVLICFSTDSPSSLANVKTKWAQLARKRCPNAPVIVVGNKTDLRYDEKSRSELAKNRQEAVKSEEARAIAEAVKAALFVECSAKKLENVGAVFEHATRLALQGWHKQAKCCLM